MADHDLPPDIPSVASVESKVCEDATDRQVVELDKLRFDDGAEVVVCAEHGSGFTNLPAVRNHLREKHGNCSPTTSIIRQKLLGNEQDGEINSINHSRVPLALSRVPKCLGGHLNLSELAEKYRRGLQCTTKVDVLPAVDGVETVFGVICNSCSFATPFDSSLCKHMTQNHEVSMKEAKEFVDRAPRRPIQSFSKNRGCTYFVVDVVDITTVKDYADAMGPFLNKSSVPAPARKLGDGDQSSQGPSAIAPLADKIHRYHPAKLREHSSKENLLPESDTQPKKVGFLSLQSETYRRETSLFLQLCGFERILSEAGYSGLDQVPIELVMGARFLVRSQVQSSERQFSVLHQERCILSHVEHYLAKTSELTNDSAPFLLRLIKPSDLGGKANRKVFRPVRTKQSIRNYANHVSRLILFCVRLHKLSSEGAHTNSHLSTFEAEITSRPTVPKIVEMCPSQLLECSGVYVQAWENVLKEGDHISKFDSKGIVKDSAYKSCAGTWNDLDLALHKLFRQILLQRRDDTNSGKAFMVRIFVAMLSIHGDKNNTARHFKSAKDLSQPLAALQYAASACALAELRARDIFQSEGSQTRNGELPESDAQVRNVFESQEYEYYSLSKVQSAFCSTANTSVGYVRDFLDKCMGIIKNDTGRIRYMACARHDMCGLVDGIELSLPKLGEAVRNWQRNAADIVEKDLLLGMRLPNSFDVTFRAMNDNFMLDDIGMNFLSLAQNREWASHASCLLLQHICMSSTLRTKWFADQIGEMAKSNGSGSEYVQTNSGLSDANDTITQLKRDTVAVWLEKAQKFQELILTISHVVGGGTARAPEISTLQCQNGYDSVRNLFVSQGEVILLTRYNKTQSMSGMDKVIARVLDPVTSRLVMMYLVLVKPFEVMLVGEFNSEEQARCHAGYLFVEAGVPYCERTIRSTVQSVFTGSGIFLNFSQYRHFQSAMADRYLSSEFVQVLHECGAFEEGGHEGTEEFYSDIGPAIHEQSGHSLRTASRRYGTGAQTVRGLASAELSRFRDTSLAWQGLLGIETHLKVMHNTKSRGVNSHNPEEFRVIVSQELNRFFPERNMACRL